MPTTTSDLTVWFEERRKLVEEQVLRTLEAFSFPELPSGLAMELHCQALAFAAAHIRDVQALSPGTSSATTPFGGYGGFPQILPENPVLQKQRRGRGPGRSRGRNAAAAEPMGLQFSADADGGTRMAVGQARDDAACSTTER